MRNYWERKCSFLCACIVSHSLTRIPGLSRCFGLYVPVCMCVVNRGFNISRNGWPRQYGISIVHPVGMMGEVTLNLRVKSSTAPRHSCHLFYTLLECHACNTDANSMQIIWITRVHTRNDLIQIMTFIVLICLCSPHVPLPLANAEHRNNITQSKVTTEPVRLSLMDC